MNAPHRSPDTRYELRYESLFDTGHALAFPCDADGRVPIDELSDKAFNSYLFARALVGYDFASPVVGLREVH